MGWGSDVRAAGRDGDHKYWSEGTKRASSWGSQTAQHRRMIKTDGRDARHVGQKARDEAAYLAAKGAKKALKSGTNAKVADAACDLMIVMIALGVFSLGTDGTEGIGKKFLTGCIRLYRLIPLRRLWHPQEGSSNWGLAAAEAGEGTSGVILAIAEHCGCRTEA